MAGNGKRELTNPPTDAFQMAALYQVLAQMAETLRQLLPGPFAPLGPGRFVITAGSSQPIQSPVPVQTWLIAVESDAPAEQVDLVLGGGGYLFKRLYAGDAIELPGRGLENFLLVNNGAVTVNVSVGYQSYPSQSNFRDGYGTAD